VMRYNFFRPIITHGENATSLGHQGSSGSRQGDKRIGADVVGRAKGLPARRDELTFEGLFWGKRNGVKQQMDFSKFVPDGFEYLRNLLIFGDITGQDEGVGTKRAGEFFDILFKPFSLICEREARARFRPGLRNSPGNGALVSHSKDNSDFTFQ